MTKYRSESVAFCSSDSPHFDDWEIRFKAFLYLTNVPEKSAPFRYWAGSHTSNKIRKAMEYEYFRDGKKGTYGCYTEKQLNEIQKRYGFICTTVVGKIGTLIWWIFRGIHTGTLLTDGSKPLITLANYFDITR